MLAANASVSAVEGVSTLPWPPPGVVFLVSLALVNARSNAYPWEWRRCDAQTVHSQEDTKGKQIHHHHRAIHTFGSSSVLSITSMSFEALEANCAESNVFPCKLPLSARWLVGKRGHIHGCCPSCNKNNRTSETQKNLHNHYYTFTMFITCSTSWAEIIADRRRIGMPAASISCIFVDWCTTSPVLVIPVQLFPRDDQQNKLLYEIMIGLVAVCFYLLIGTAAVAMAI